MHHEPDYTFPNGIPNPLLVENRPATADAVVSKGADGIAFDGDFDRCFFFDETGSFIGGEYVMSLLATSFLRRKSGLKHYMTRALYGIFKISWRVRAERQSNPKRATHLSNRR